MIEFLRKFENRDIKIALVNSILIAKSINTVIYFNFVRFEGLLFKRFSVLSPFIEKSVVLQISLI